MKMKNLFYIFFTLIILSSCSNKKEQLTCFDTIKLVNKMRELPANKYTYYVYEANLNTVNELIERASPDSNYATKCDSMRLILKQNILENEMVLINKLKNLEGGYWYSSDSDKKLIDSLISNIHLSIYKTNMKIDFNRESKNITKKDNAPN